MEARSTPLSSQNEAWEMQPLFSSPYTARDEGQLPSAHLNYATFDLPSSSTRWGRFNWRWPFAFKCFNGFISLITAAPLAPYAFGFFSGVSPKQFSWPWFYNLPIWLKLVSIAGACISLAVNALVRYNYYPQMVQKVVSELSRCFTSIGRCLRNNIVLFFSIATAISAYGVGYDGFTWINGGFAIFTAVSNFIVTGGFRIVFITSFIERVKSMFDTDEQIRQHCLMALSTLTNEQQAQLNSYLMGKPLNDAMMAKIVKKCLRHFETLPLSFHIKRYSLQTFDVAMGLFVGLAYFLFFSQYGYRGLEVICHLITSECSMHTLPHLANLAIASLTGLSSGVLGFMTGLVARDVFLDCYSTMHHVRDYMKLILIFAVSLYASGGLINPAMHIASNSNLFGLTMSNLTGPLFVAGCGLLSVLFDSVALVKLFMMPSEKASATNIEKVQRDLKDDPTGLDTLKNLRMHGFFSKQKEQLIPSKLVNACLPSRQLSI